MARDLKILIAKSWCVEKRQIKERVKKMEAGTGIEPTYKDLQSSA